MFDAVSSLCSSRLRLIHELLFCVLEHISGPVLAVEVSLSSCCTRCVSVLDSLSSCSMDGTSAEETGASDVVVAGVCRLWNASGSEGSVDVLSNVIKLY